MRERMMRKRRRIQDRVMGTEGARLIQGQAGCSWEESRLDARRHRGAPTERWESREGGGCWV